MRNITSSTIVLILTSYTINFRVEGDIQTQTNTSSEETTTDSPKSYIVVHQRYAHFGAKIVSILYLRPFRSYNIFNILFKNFIF